MGASSGTQAEERYEYSQIIMGTQARIVLYASDEENGREAASAAFARMIALDNMLTDWRADSELMQLCAAAGGAPVPVSDDLFEVLERSLVFARESDGAFDITLGPLTQLWRETREQGVLPAPDRLKRARARTGWRRIELLRDETTGSQRVRLKAGTRLDLGGIAKGYACDKALDTLRANGINSALVEIGGDLVVSEAPPDREGWRVSAGCDDSTSPKVISLVNAAIATSGDTEQFVLIDGTRYSHILDPRTGLGLTHAHCVSIISKDATTADALASAISVLSKSRGQELVTLFDGSDVSAPDVTEPGIKPHTWQKHLPLKINDYSARCAVLYLVR
ncbi:MAG: thiamine biosynthesis lipoprotein [Planctomycetota bacterium]|jgi:thiamine biosynthesis lipoprotein